MDVAEKHAHDSSHSAENFHDIEKIKTGIASSETAKSGQILAACDGDGDLIALRRLATSIGGLLSDDLRNITCWRYPDAAEDSNTDHL